MRKFLNIFICISLLISTFDILDVNDITLGNREIFTSNDEPANDTEDDMECTSTISNTGGLVFHLPSRISHSVLAIQKEPVRLVNTKKQEYDKYTINLYRPPII